jgi:hypothetical protein
MTEKSKPAVAMVAWLATFGILLFGDFRFNNWTEDFGKNILGIGLIAVAAAVTGVFSCRTSSGPPVT